MNDLPMTWSFQKKVKIKINNSIAIATYFDTLLIVELEKSHLPVHWTVILYKKRQHHKYLRKRKRQADCTFSYQIQVLELISLMFICYYICIFSLIINSVYLRRSGTECFDTIAYTGCSLIAKKIWKLYIRKE